MGAHICEYPGEESSPIPIITERERGEKNEQCKVTEIERFFLTVIFLTAISKSFLYRPHASITMNRFLFH